jgi:peptide methionine sulfoxide reductase MsrB
MKRDQDKPDSEWKKQLSPVQYAVLREKGTTGLRYCINSASLTFDKKSE